MQLIGKNMQNHDDLMILCFFLGIQTQKTNDVMSSSIIVDFSHLSCFFSLKPFPVP